MYIVQKMRTIKKMLKFILPFDNLFHASLPQHDITANVAEEEEAVFNSNLWQRRLKILIYEQ